MRALVLKAFGGPENFAVQEIPKPAVRSGTLLIRLAATSVNSIDIRIREGALTIAPPLPAVLGSDIAGTVEEVGDGVSEFSVGEEVYGCAGGVKGLGGTLAEYIVADAKLMAPKPKRLSMRESAALPLVCISAVQALERIAPSFTDYVLVRRPGYFVTKPSAKMSLGTADTSVRATSWRTLQRCAISLRLRMVGICIRCLMTIASPWRPGPMHIGVSNPDWPGGRW